MQASPIFRRTSEMDRTVTQMSIEREKVFKDTDNDTQQSIEDVQMRNTERIDYNMEVIDV
jgi:hypothetical protein